MIDTRPRPLRRVALLFTLAAALAALVPGNPAAAVIATAQSVRAEGRAPVLGGRADTAYQQALDEAFRRGVLDVLRGIAPERQSPHDLETWQETVLTRAGDFVGAWRVLSQEQADGFMTLEVEIEVYREKLTRAAQSTGTDAAPAARVLVLAGSLPLIDRFAEEEIDAGLVAASAFEAELARRGAIVVAAADRALWEQISGPLTEDMRKELAVAAARKVNANAVLIAQLTREGERLALVVQLIAVASGTTLVSARADTPVLGDRPLSSAVVRAARQLAAACAPHLAAVRTKRKPSPW